MTRFVSPILAISAAVHQLSIPAVVVSTLALVIYPPVQAQSIDFEASMVQTDADLPNRNSAADGTMAQNFDKAMQEYDRCHWVVAFEQLVLLADRGDTASSRLVMQMYLYGPLLYGQTFVLLPGQMQRFARTRWQPNLTLPTTVR